MEISNSLHSLADIELDFSLMISFVIFRSLKGIINRRMTALVGVKFIGSSW